MNDLSGSFTPTKKPQKKVLVDNPFERGEKNIVSQATESMIKTSSDAVKDMWNQILGADKYAAGNTANKGDLQAGKEVSLKEHKSTSEAPMSYFKEIRDAGKDAMRQEKAEISRELQGIMYELQRLASSSKAIEQHVSQAVGTGVMKQGRGTINFLDMVLQTLRTARKKVENAGAWLATVKKKKGFIQGMKKNMSQYLSGERGIATQNG